MRCIEGPSMVPSGPATERLIASVRLRAADHCDSRDQDHSDERAGGVWKNIGESAVACPRRAFLDLDKETESDSGDK